MASIRHRCAFLVLLLFLLSACALPSVPSLSNSATPTPSAAPPTPTPVALASTYRFEAGGFSVGVPQDWQTRAYSNTLALAARTADLDQSTPGEGLVVLIDSTPLETVAQQYGQEAITTTLSFFRASSAAPRQAGYTLGDTTPITIAGASGLRADMRAAGGVGQLIVVLGPQQAVRILGQSAPEAWERHRPLFEAIVASVQLFPPLVVTPTPADQALQPVLLDSGPPGFVLRLGGKEGPRGGRFASARGLAVAPDGTVYLAESSRGVWVFAPDGMLRTSFGKGELLDAYDVAYAPGGDLFVADYGRNAIVRFKPDGSVVQRWGSAGDGPEQFGLSAPQRIALGPEGQIYALDSRINPDNQTAVSSIVRFNGDDGSFIERIALPPGSAPNDLAVDGQGNIYLAEAFGGAVVKINGKGEVLARLGENLVPEGLAAGAIDLDRQGNVYVATWGAGILMLSPGGVLLARGGAAAKEGSIPLPGQFSLPNGIAALPNGNVWVSDNSGEYSAVTALRLATDATAQATANAQAALVTPLPDGSLLRQWASSATASSFYEGYPPERATGAPNVPGCQDSPDAWASADPNGLDTLELRYTTPVFATGVAIHQNHQPGFITRVEVLDERGTLTSVYSGTAALQTSCPAVLTVNFAQTPYRVVGVKLTVDQRSGANWNEIDAVELLGLP